MMIRILCMVFGFSWICPLHGQTSKDSVQTQVLRLDSLPPEPGAFNRFFTKGYPNPRKAVLFAIIPGGGQIYNKKWWKLPIVYGALGATTWILVDNTRQYRLLRDNYKLQVDGDPNTNPEEFPYNAIDPTAMRNYRDQWRRYVELSSVSLGLVFLLTVTDAFVDAHLASFDVSDDLSLHIRPSFDAGLGIGVSLGFH